MRDTGAGPDWRPGRDAPTSRQEVASTVAAGRVWVIGGLSPAGLVATVESYDVAADRWHTEAPLPFGLHHATAATFRGEVVVIGGFLSGTDLYAQPSDQVLALRGGSWVALPRLSRPRGAAAAAVVGDRLMVVGGRDAQALVAPSEVFDGNSWSDAPAVPEPRDHLAAASDGRFLYAAGGRFLQPSRTSAALHRFDSQSRKWDTLPDMPTARGGLGVALAGTNLVAAGGESDTDVFAELEVFDLVERRWSARRDLPTPRHGLAVAALGDQLVVLNGGIRAGLGPSATVEVLALR